MLNNLKNRVVGLLCIAAFASTLSSCNFIQKDSKTKENVNGQTSPTKVLEPVTKHKTMLGTICKITIYDNPSDTNFEKAFNKIQQIENEMSINLDTSEVISINAKAGEDFVKVSDETYYVIKKGVYYSDLTKGLFDISIGPLVKIWDIGGENPRLPTAGEIETAKNVVDYKDVILNESEKKVMLKKKGMILDLGGIAKGYAADAVAEVLKANGVKHGIINLGGNVLTLGTKLDGSNWRVGIQNPFSNRGEYVGVIEVSDKTIVTSGIYERYFEANGKHYHHLLNPFTGYPFENNLAGITIVTEKSIDADSLSTSTFALGLEEGYRFVEGIEGVEAIFVTTNNELFITSGLVNNFTITDGSFSIKELK